MDLFAAAVLCIGAALSESIMHLIKFLLDACVCLAVRKAKKLIGCVFIGTEKGCPYLKVPGSVCRHLCTWLWD